MIFVLFLGPAFGELIHVSSPLKPEDHTGCQLPLASTRSDRQLPPSGTPWIALIKRGKCNFEIKVDNAFRSNAAGVLVYNDRDSASLDKMKLSSDSRRKYNYHFYCKLVEDTVKLGSRHIKPAAQILLQNYSYILTNPINAWRCSVSITKYCITKICDIYCF